MSYAKKFKITGLKKKESILDASKIILDHKIRIVFKEITVYKENESADNLHSLRIAIRRLRYVMEIFHSCIKPKFFNSIYDYVTKLQDLLGEVRDWDILEEKVRKTEKETGNKMPESFYKNIDKERMRIKEILIKELTDFFSDKDVKKFLLN